MTNVIKNKKQYAYDIIRERILDNTYVPGYRLIIDRLSKELGLSAIPVREAMRSLEADGLIKYKPFSGPEVRFINEKEYIESLSVLAVLEGYATALSSEYIKTEELMVLETINEKMKLALKNSDIDQCSELNLEFHSYIYQHCLNSYLVNEIKTIQEKVSIIRGTKTGLSFRLLPQRRLESIEEHQEIIGLLRKKASHAEIETLVRKHKMSAVRIYEKKIKDRDDE